MKQKLITFLRIFPAIIVVALAANTIANAQTPPAIVKSYTDVGSNLFCPITSFFFSVLLAISVIMALWAAFTYITASDDTEKTTKARRILLYAAIGIVVALIAYGFPSLVGSIFNQGSNTTFQC